MNMKEFIKGSAQIWSMSVKYTMKDGNAIGTIAAITIGAAIADKKLSRDAIVVGLAATGALIGYNYSNIYDALYEEAKAEMEEFKED